MSSFLSFARPEQLQALSDGHRKTSLNLYQLDRESQEIVMVRTASGNAYYIEMSDPQKNKFHVYRLHSRGEGIAGYRGTRIFTNTKLQIGGKLTYYRVTGEYMESTEIVEIWIFKNPQGK